MPFIRTDRDREKKEKYRCLQSTAAGFPVFRRSSKTTGHMKHLDQSPPWTGEKNQSAKRKIERPTSQGESRSNPGPVHLRPGLLPPHIPDSPN